MELAPTVEVKFVTGRIQQPDKKILKTDQQIWLGLIFWLARNVKNNEMENTMQNVDSCHAAACHNPSHFVTFKQLEQALIEQVTLSVLRNDSDEVSSTDSGFQENLDDTASTAADAYNWVPEDMIGIFNALQTWNGAWTK